MEAGINVLDLLRRFATPDQTPWTVDETIAALEPFSDPDPMVQQMGVEHFEQLGVDTGPRQNLNV